MPLNIHESLRFLRSKIYGQILDRQAFDFILKDIIEGRYSDIHLAAFVTACAGDHLSEDEMLSLTQSMIASGDRLQWDLDLVLDKHCVGGLPGNRTTIIVIPILAALGLVIPKTSSRAITSPAGTADTMEIFCPVNLDLKTMKQVTRQEGACIAWGGGLLTLSPADDILIRIERALDLDSVGLMVASVISKKVAAGSSHVLIDMPVGPTAKVRSLADANRLSTLFKVIGTHMGLRMMVHQSDGRQPVGRGIGPSLEARDVLSVLKGEAQAPQDLRDHALDLAGMLLEMSEKFASGQGRWAAEKTLKEGLALKKFYAICEAQGGLRQIKQAEFKLDVKASHGGVVSEINNRKIAMVAKIAGAPKAPKAGVDFLSPLGSRIEKQQVLFTIHAESKSLLHKALEFVDENPDIVGIL